jgi:hypothetical protein
LLAKNGIAFFRSLKAKNRSSFGIVYQICSFSEKELRIAFFIPDLVVIERITDGRVNGNGLSVRHTSTPPNQKKDKNKLKNIFHQKVSLSGKRSSESWFIGLK